MNKLDDLLTLQTALLAIGIYVVTMILRKLIEAVWPELSRTTPIGPPQRIWEEFVLPTLPCVLGIVFCLVVAPVSFSYPPVVAATLMSRALYGVAVGWFSGWGYHLLTAILQKKWGPAPDPPGKTDKK